MKPAPQILSNHPRLSARFRPIRPLGASALGRTTLVEEIATGKLVALKELSVAAAEDWKEIELFERGARTLKSLDHPQIPTILDAFYEEDEDLNPDENQIESQRKNTAINGRFFLAQAFIEGIDLKQKLQKDGPFSPDEVVEFLNAMLDILAYLGEFSPPVVHRDIKPSNILLCPDNTFALIDFDALQTIIPGELGGSTVVGTYGYMPPEQLIGRAQPASDLYALGATAVHLLSGISPDELPFRRGALDLGELAIPDQRLHACLAQLLQVDPQRRGDVENARKLLSGLSPAGSITATTNALATSTPRAQVAPPGSRLPPANLDYPSTYMRRRSMQSYLEISSHNDALRITLFSRPHGTGLTLATFPAFLAACCLAILVFMGASWSVILGLSALTFGITWIGCWYHFRTEILETGVEQTLTLTRQGARLSERAIIRWWPQGERRALQNWSLPRDRIQDVRFELSEDILNRAEQSLLTPDDSLSRIQLIHAETTPRAGLALVDQSGESYVFGADLAGLPNYHHEISTAADAIHAYLAHTSANKD